MLKLIFLFLAENTAEIGLLNNTNQANSTTTSIYTGSSILTNAGTMGIVKSYPQQYHSAQKMNQVSTATAVSFNKNCDKSSTTSDLTLASVISSASSSSGGGGGGNAISTSNNSIASLTNTNGTGYFILLVKKSKLI